jgi:beta-hydroxylase
MNIPLLATELTVLGALVASASYVHFRGKVRHKFARQLLDHSTFMAPYNTLVYLFSGTKNTPILDRNDFNHLNALRDNWQTIRDEVRVLYEEGHIKKSEKHNDVAFSSFFKRGWKRFYLKWYDEVLPSAKQLCPKTVELVQSIPSINAALFAFLPPGGKLGEHRDPFAGSLRYHLGLITPNSDKCRIYVDGTPYAWRDGEDIVFDETYIHSVTNETDQARIILFCDVARPIRNPIVRGINRFVTNHLVKATSTQNEATEKIGLINRLISPVFVLRDAFQRMKKWNRNFYYATKYAILLGILFLLVLPFLNLRG